MRALGAELRLAPALRADAGRYACAARAPDGAAARRDLELQVRSEAPPQLSGLHESREYDRLLSQLYLSYRRSSKNIALHVFTGADRGQRRASPVRSIRR